MAVFEPLKHPHFSAAISQDFSAETAGSGTFKVSMLRGSVLARSLLGKVLDLAASYPERHLSLPHRHPKTHPTLILAQESLNL
jgi:hypothetical protein